MAKSLKALVKMDDYATTASTGGIVEEIITMDTKLDEEAAERGTTYEYAVGKNEPEYKMVDCDETVKVGWIYQDKTGVLRDPNSQYKYINKVIASSGASSIPHKGLTGDKNGRQKNNTAHRPW